VLCSLFLVRPLSIQGLTKAEDDTDLVLMEDLKSWFVSLKISSSVARKYAEIIVENNTGRISKLQRKVEKNSHYLEEIGGFDEDDIADIKQGLLQLSSPIGDGSSGEEKKDFPHLLVLELLKLLITEPSRGKKKNWLKIKQLLRRTVCCRSFLLTIIILWMCLHHHYPGFLLVIRLLLGHGMVRLKHGMPTLWNY
jgi:hypothetical protein